MELKEINERLANEIIRDRNPIGLFIAKLNDEYVGINNLTGEASVEFFKDKQQCRDWLHYGYR